MTIAAIKQAIRRKLPFIKRKLINLGEKLFDLLKLHWKILGITLGLLIMANAGYRNYQKEYTQLMEQGQNHLNMGLYSEAKTYFQKAKDEHPIIKLAGLAAIFGENAEKSVKQLVETFDLTEQASLGLKKAELATTIAEQRPESVEQQFQALLKESPDDADIYTMWGKYELSSDLNKAQEYYTKAIEYNPNIAEAHFGLCYLYDIQNKINEEIKKCKDKAISECEIKMTKEFESKAIEECETAVKLSEKTDYKINLAGLYITKGNIAEAEKLIKTLDGRYLNTLFELSKGYLFSNELTKAIDLQKQVLAADVTHS